MLLDVDLAPSGELASRILVEWREAWKLGDAHNGKLRLRDANPLDVIMDLRERCYDLGITVEIAFLD